MRRGPTAAWFAVSLVGCVSAGGPPSPDEALIGCYQFEWNADAAELGLPWGFELLGAPLEGWDNVPDGRAARTRVTESTVRDHPFAFWMRLPADTVRVAHPGGGGFVLTLTLRGRDLAGLARPAGDLISPGRAAPPSAPRPVTARRVVCPPPAG